MQNRIVEFAIRLGQTEVRDAATPRVHEYDRDVNTSREQESSSNCASSAAGGTTLRRRRTARVVHALSRQDPTEQHASNRTPEVLERGCVCARSRQDCAVLTTCVVPQKHVLSEIDSTFPRKCKSEGVECIFAGVKYTEPRL